MSRYADQLPINLAPNGANFLLATNDSDGKALERIAWGMIHGILLETQTANYSAESFEKIPLDSTAGSFTVTLPESGGIIWLFDAGATLTTNPVNLVAPTGYTVNGASSYSLNINRGAWKFELFGTNWIKF